MTIKEKQDQLVNEYNKISDWEERYKKIISLGKSLPAIDVKYKTDENLVSGCQSRVWLHAWVENGLVYFMADSDATITKGLVGLLVTVYSGHSPTEILTTPPNFITELGLNTNLSQSRANGLASMMKQIKIYATAFLVKLQSNK